MSEEEETEDVMVDLGDEVDFDGEIDLGDDDLLVDEEVDLELNTREIE